MCGNNCDLFSDLDIIRCLRKMQSYSGIFFMHISQTNVWAAIHTLFNNSNEAGSEVINLLKQEKETNDKLKNQEIRSLISENNSIKFENLTLKAKVNELRNTIDSYSDQIDNECERWKKTCHPKNRVPPTC